MPPLLGTLYGLLIWLALSSGLAFWLKQSADAIKMTAAAAQTLVMADAFSRYVRDHGADIATTATATNPVTITVNQLRGSYLAAGAMPTSLYGQTFLAQAVQPLPGKLLTMMFTTGTTQLPPNILVPLAAQSSSNGSLGGFVPYANQAGDATMQPAIAVGVGGSFRQSLANFYNPGSGHLAMMLNVSDVDADNGYLYRVNMKPGRPDLNAMQTDLSMTDTSGNAHTINGANSLNLTSGAAFDSDQGGSLELGDVAGSSASAAPYIDFHRGGQGQQDFNTRIQATDNQRLAVQGVNGQVTLDVQGGVKLAAIATPGASCPENGVVAANSDGSGQTNTCQYGKWMPNGQPVPRYGYYAVVDNSFVPAPTCPAPAQQIMELSIQGFSVNETATVNAGPGTWTGNGWIVHLKDGAGNPLTGNAIAGTYCAYQGLS